MLIFRGVFHVLSVQSSQNQLKTVDILQCPNSYTTFFFIVYLTSISLSYDIWSFGVLNFQLCHKAQQFFTYVSRGTEPFDEFHSSRSCNSTSIVNDLDRLWKCSNGSKGPNSAKKHKQKHCNQQSSELNCHMAFEASYQIIIAIVHLRSSTSWNSRLIHQGVCCPDCQGIEGNNCAQERQ